MVQMFISKKIKLSEDIGIFRSTLKPVMPETWVSVSMVTSHSVRHKITMFMTFPINDGLTHSQPPVRVPETGTPVPSARPGSLLVVLGAWPFLLLVLHGLRQICRCWGVHWLRGRHCWSPLPAPPSVSAVTVRVAVWHVVTCKGRVGLILSRCLYRPRGFHLNRGCSRHHRCKVPMTVMRSEHF